MSLIWLALHLLSFFYFLEYIINNNTRKLKRSPIDDIIDNNDASVFIVFENYFQYRMW